MKVNREIRAPKVRLIGVEGEQLGVVPFFEALKQAEELGLDLVEIAPNVVPPVCKIIDYGKYRYDQTKREKESKKAQHQIKVKEVKLKPNIDDNDLETKNRHAKEFLEKGNKVKVTCTLRGREMVHPEIGEEIVKKFCEKLTDYCEIEAPAKRMGRVITVVLAPSMKKKKAVAPQTPAEGTPPSV
ncbi:MAG: translation initiation factor IF-3 [Parachlamydiales bacterium]